MGLGADVQRVKFKACADAREALDAAWEAHLHDAAPTIAAVLDHRLAEAQRLGLRVKALKVSRDEFRALLYEYSLSRYNYFGTPPFPPDPLPEGTTFHGYPLSERHAPTL